MLVAVLVVCVVNLVYTVGRTNVLLANQRAIYRRLKK